MLMSTKVVWFLLLKAMQYIQGYNRHQSYFSTLVAVAAITPQLPEIFISN
jgi:hypothetical protein